MYKSRLHDIAQRGYIQRKSQYRRRRSFDWEDVISPDSSTFNDEEFQQLFRMSRTSFNEFHDKIKNHSVFKATPHKKKPRPSYQQFMVFLYRLGKEGNGGNGRAVAAFFRIGYSN